MHDHLHVVALRVFNQFIHGARSSTNAFNKVCKFYQLVCETLSFLLLVIQFLLAR